VPSLVDGNVAPIPLGVEAAFEQGPHLLVVLAFLPLRGLAHRMCFLGVGIN
jgi:hypothetical protein